MPAFAHDDVLDAALQAILDGGTQIDVVSADCGGTWSNISIYSLGTFAYNMNDAEPLQDEGTGRKIVVPEIAMGSVGVAGSLTTGHIVIHDNSSKIFFQTPCSGSDITLGAAVTVATFDIVNPLPTSS